MIVVEVSPAINAAGTVQTFLLSTEAFTTRGTDTPAHTSAYPFLLDPGSIGVHAYSSGQTTTGGGTKLEIGEIQISNADGAFDTWLNYGFDGRPVIIRSGNASLPYPSGWKTLFNGTAEGIDTANWSTLTLRLRDKQYVLDLPAQVNTYAGNNALPLGFEGTADDLKGQAKPRVFGSVFQMSPKLVNTSKLTYQVNDGAVSAITAVYDRGVLLTLGTDFATATALQASTPAAGTYNTCLAAGYFQLGSNPAGTITADVVQGANAAARTVAQVLKSIALTAGLTTADISAADVTALDATNNGVVGVLVDDTTTTFLSLMDQVAASLGGWYGFDTTGVLRMGQLLVPSGTPVLDLQTFDVDDSIERLAAYDNNIPVWWVVLNYKKIWTTQTDLAGSVTPATKAYLAEEFRSVTYKDATVQNLHKLATKLEVDSLFVDATVATNEATRQFNLYSVRRDIFEVTISTALLPANLKFMDVVRLTVNRFGLNSGKLLRLIGISYKLQTAQVTLSLWG